MRDPGSQAAGPYQTRFPDEFALLSLYEKRGNFHFCSLHHLLGNFQHREQPAYLDPFHSAGLLDRFGHRGESVLFGLKISLRVPKGIHAQQRAVFLITLRNLKNFFPSFALQLKGENEEKEESQDTDFFVQAKRFPYVRAGERLRLRLQCQFGRRGVYPVEGFEVKTTFPFGFFGRGRKLDAEGNIIVYPELQDLGPLFTLHPDIHGVEEKSRKGSSNDLYNIRPYEAGDSARFVHWKSTAKLASLMVKDFSLEQEVPLNVLFSTYLPDPSGSDLEQFEKSGFLCCITGPLLSAQGSQIQV